MSKSIYVIDDYLINLMVAKMIIKHHGFFDKITLYSEAQKALEDLVGNRDNKMLLPDVILLDIHMPVMNGWQFLDEFEMINPCFVKDIEIYILSSSTDIAEIRRSRQYKSVNGFLSKPLEAEMLENMLTTRLPNAS